MLRRDVAAWRTRWERDTDFLAGEVDRLAAGIRDHDRRYTRDGGGLARCYPVMGELLDGQEATDA